VATTTTTPVITVVQAPALRSATTTVSVSASTAPTSGQVLTATSGTAATWQTPSGAGLTNFTEAVNSSAPNATVPAVSFTATNAVTDVDFVIKAKGAGAILAQIPDNGTGGGNKRGAGAVDLQMSRSAATQVASGIRATAMGINNTASGNQSVALGQSNIASNSQSVAMGNGNTTSGSRSVSIGNANTASGGSSFAIGNSNTASGTYSVAT